MTSRQRNKLLPALCVAANIAIAIVAAAFASPAHADLTVVTETKADADVSGASRDGLADLGDLARPLTLAVSYNKGKLGRFETQDRIILRGLQDGKITVLNTGDRTYYVTTESDELKRTNRGASMMSIAGGEGELRSPPVVTQLDETHLLQGMTAYGLNFSIVMDYKFPATAGQILNSLSLTYSGEVWSSPSMPTVAGDVQSDKMVSSLPKPMLAALAKLGENYKGNLLGVTFNMDLDAAHEERHVKLKLVMHQNVRAISHEPLSDDLFRIPEDCHEVPVPAKAPAAAGTPTPPDTAAGVPSPRGAFYEAPAPQAHQVCANVSRPLKCNTVQISVLESDGSSKFAPVAPRGCLAERHSAVGFNPRSEQAQSLLRKFPFSSTWVDPIHENLFEQYCILMGGAKSAQTWHNPDTHPLLIWQKDNSIA